MRHWKNNTISKKAIFLNNISASNGLLSEPLNKQVGYNILVTVIKIIEVLIFFSLTMRKKGFLYVLHFKTGLIMAPLIVLFPIEMVTPSPLPPMYLLCISILATLTIYTLHYLRDSYSSYSYFYLFPCYLTHLKNIRF